MSADPDCGRSRRLGRRGADPARLFAALGRAADRPVAHLSGDERARRGGFRRSTAGGTGIAVGGAQYPVDADRSLRIMADLEEKRIVDLSHVIEHGMTTYKGLPGPQSAISGSARARPRTTTTGRHSRSAASTWSRTPAPIVDSPFHRYADGADLAESEAAVACRRARDRGPPSVGERPRRSNRQHLEGRDVGGKAVLVHTGWDRHWRTEGYFGEHPYLTAEAADWLVEHGAAMVGIDSCNIDNIHVRARPVHTKLLGAEIPICEHMTGLGSLPDEGFRFSAVPPKVTGSAPSRCAPTPCSAEPAPP